MLLEHAGHVGACSAVAILEGVNCLRTDGAVLWAALVDALAR